MVRYHGRARQLVNINRKQPGQKMQGSYNRTGSLISSWRIHQNRVNENAVVGCVDAQGNLTGKRRVFDKKGCAKCITNVGYLLIRQAPASRACAGGVNRYFPLGCR